MSFARLSVFSFIYLGLSFWSFTTGGVWIFSVLSCLLCAAYFYFARGEIRSPLSIVVIMHAVSFILPVWFLFLGNHTLAIEDHLWAGTERGFKCLFIFLSVALIGSCIRDLSKLHLPRAYIKLSSAILFQKYFGFFVFYIGCAFLFVSGSFYHKDINSGPGLSGAGFVGYFLQFGVLFCVLQAIGLYQSNKIHYGIGWLFLLLPFLILGFSGSRSAAFPYLLAPIMWLVGGHVRGGGRVNALLIIFVPVGLLFFAILIEQYRIGSNFSDLLSMFSQKDIIFAVIGRRLADIYSVVHIVTEIEAGAPLLGLWGLDEFLSWLPPAGLRASSWLDYNYDAVLMMEQLRFRPDIGGSSPLMFLGEAFLRFGYSGVFLSSLFIVMLLLLLELIIYKFGRFGVLIWCLSFVPLINLHQYSFLKVFVFFFRQIPIIFILLLLVGAFYHVVRAASLSKLRRY